MSDNIWDWRQLEEMGVGHICDNGVSFLHDVLKKDCSRCRENKRITRRNIIRNKIKKAFQKLLILKE